MTTLILIHVLLSLVGILSGLVVFLGMLASKQYEAWTRLFLATTLATSVTGFLFPFHGVGPAHVIGIVSLTVLSVAIYARYGRRLAGVWGRIWVVSAVTSLYLNVFVLVVQSFLKIPVLQAIAPTQGEPPFKITQLVVLVLFISLGALATARYRSAPASFAPEA
jgi:hypothetical protein